MRVFILGIFCSLAFVACQNQNSKTEEMIEEAMRESKADVDLIGADVDRYGCKGSAGYTWSQLRRDCVRIFEEGITLLPIQAEESEAVYAAFVLYSEDNTIIELFLPTEKESILLQKIESGVYEDGKYKFQEGEKILYIDGQAKYKVDQS